MTPSLLVMVGTGRLTDDLSAQWIEHVDTMRQDALPLLAVSPRPVPSVLLDTEKRPELRALIWALRTAAGADFTFLVTWCAVMASDLSVADTFLLVNVIKPLTCRIIVRFHLLRHHATLVCIDQVRQLTLCTTPPQASSVRLALDVPDLGEQLAQVQAYQALLSRQREE